MFAVRPGVSRGFRLAIYGLVSVMAVLAVATDSADARDKRKRGGANKDGGYNPPYSSIVVDANSGKVLQETGADSLRHPASLTKIMTLYLLFEHLDAGKIKLNTAMPVSENAAAQAPTKLGLRPGQSVEVGDAIRALVTKSANDAAVVIAEALAGDEDDFAKLMTKKARALGMSRTVYRNASGLPDNEQVTTARDQALLGRAVQDRFPQYYRYFAIQSFTYRGASMRNHNHLLGRLEGVDGIKTGYTRASGFNLVASVRRNNRHIVAVVLGGRSADARDARMRSLITEKIVEASNRRTAPILAEAAEAAEPRANSHTAAAPSSRGEFALADASSVAAPVKAPSAAATRQAPGSSDPIKPIAVKTIKVKLSAMQTASFAPPAIPTPAHPADEAISTQSVSPAKAVLNASPPVAPSQTDLPVVPAKTNTKTTPTVPKSEPAIAPPRNVHAHSGWIVQVGAFDGEGEAKRRLNAAQTKAKRLLGHADAFTETVVKGNKTFYRARFAGLEKSQAEAACKYLKRNDIICLTIKN